MGITISRTVTEPTIPIILPPLPEQKDDDDVRARLRLQSHQLKPFNGRSTRSTEFPKWKIHTECVLNGTGYERILVDQPYALTHPGKNTLLVYSQLSMATADGDASPIVTKHKKTQDGYQAWQDVLTFFHGSQRSIRTARSIRSKLLRLTLSEGMTASAYINKFQTWHRDLEDINDGAKAYTCDTKLQAFLDNIHHPKYTMTVGCIRNITDMDMDIAIDRIRQTETELEAERGEKRKMNVLRRQIYIEDGLRPPDEEDEDLPFHTPVTPSPRAKKRRRLDTNANTKLCHIAEGWSELPQSDKDFVTSWNSRARHGESTKDIKIPTGVTLHPHVKADEPKRIRRQIQEAKGPTAAMLKADKKRIHFNLEGHGEEDVDLDMD
jgi:hypothetical protein